MNKISDIIKQALNEARLPFSFQTSTCEVKLITDQKRFGERCTEVSYTTEDEMLRVFLRLESEDESNTLRITSSFCALKSLPYTINNIKIADLNISSNGGDTKLWAATGGFTLWGKEAAFPPLMLRDTVYDIAPGEEKHISSNLSGRSSDENLPIWIAQVDDTGGVWFGAGMERIMGYDHRPV